MYNRHEYTTTYSSPLFLSVFPLISRRKFAQMEVLEGLNVLVCINGRKNKLRVYYLSWLRNKIVKGDDVVSIVAMAIVVLPWQCVVVVVMLIFRSDRWRVPDRDTGSFQWGSWTNVSTSKSVSGEFYIIVGREETYIHWKPKCPWVVVFLVQRGRSKGF